MRNSENKLAYCVFACKIRVMVAISVKKKQYARNQVAKAIRMGDLIRPDRCPECGLPKRIIGHHEDYEKPLEVDWVCDVCHKAIHCSIVMEGMCHNMGLLAEGYILDEHDDQEDDIPWGRYFEQLTYREREVIKLRYGFGDGYAYTLKEVARIFKVTGERVRQVEKNAIERLKSMVA